MATEGMSSSQQSLIYGFLLNALIRTRRGSVLSAGRKASNLLRRVMDHDEQALEEVAALCDLAERWQGWQDSSGQVRSALVEHAARAEADCRGAAGPNAPARPAGRRGGTLREAPAADQEQVHDPEWWADYEQRFLEEEVEAARESADLALLDAWSLLSSLSLEAFLDLWEPAPDPHAPEDS